MVLRQIILNLNCLMRVFFKRFLVNNLILKPHKSHSISMFSSLERPFTIIVEGNIGCGKTTFLNNFQKNPKFFTLYEPVQEWKDINGFDLMNLFYSDKRTWGFTFQTYVLLTMMKSHEKKTDKQYKMMERSIYSGRYVFIENLSRLKIISKPELSVLDEWFKWLITRDAANVDLIVYLRTDPQIAHQRILKRARKGENLPFEYVTKVHELYESWLFDKKSFELPAPVWCLDANKGIEAVKSEYDCLETQLKI